MGNRLTRFMEHFWWRTMCPVPDQPTLGSLILTNFIYNWTAKRASYWHKINCDQCADRHQ